MSDRKTSTCILTGVNFDVATIQTHSVSGREVKHLSFRNILRLCKDLYESAADITQYSNRLRYDYDEISCSLAALAARQPSFSQLYAAQ